MGYKTAVKWLGRWFLLAEKGLFNFHDGSVETGDLLGYQTALK
jgi:hypothetical protein